MFLFFFKSPASPSREDCRFRCHFGCLIRVKCLVSGLYSRLTSRKSVPWCWEFPDFFTCIGLYVYTYIQQRKNEKCAEWQQEPSINLSLHSKRERRAGGTFPVSRLALHGSGARLVGSTAPMNKSIPQKQLSTGVSISLRFVGLVGSLAPPLFQAGALWAKVVGDFLGASLGTQGSLVFGRGRVFEREKGELTRIHDVHIIVASS